MIQQQLKTLPSLRLILLLLLFSHASFSTETNTASSYNEEELVSDDDFYIDEYSENRFFFSIEALLGGNTLEHITFDDGETDSIRAGSGVYLALGAAHLMFDKSIDIGIKSGILFDTVTVKNKDTHNNSVLSFVRYPLDIFGHIWLDRHIIGGGISYHINPVFKSNKTSDTASYKNALGLYAEYLYHFTGTGTAIGIKYLSIRYENADNNKSADGSGLGITFSQIF